MKHRHLQKERAYARSRYRRLVEAGLCCQCAKVPPMEGSKRCGTCRSKNLEASRNRARKMRKAWALLKICVCCGQREAMPNRSQCGACADARDELHEKHRLQKKAA
ncbi:hypothetical protein [Mesoterricola sediminis]|uniref:Uncharacterized protein n=1 Tax=Mesoterricola sediminis TaxID=2927980 RepID=A0AA48KF99_9BACT|nr:hypothetical protein [Mesoterricola sediminis]BDU76238.1 hypothetical protein METESE_11960 [Mesoterricola sediminis]